MFAAGYLDYDDAQQRYALPAEHVPALATEPGPAFFGGVHQELIGAIQRYDQVAEAFRRGGGVRPADLHPDVWAGTSRFTAQWHQNTLVQQWLPLVPETTARLPGSYDVVTTFDVVHDAVDPLGLLRSIRDALRPGGSYLCLEINCSDQATANVGPIATLLYGF